MQTEVDFEKMSDKEKGEAIAASLLMGLRGPMELVQNLTALAQALMLGRLIVVPNEEFMADALRNADELGQEPERLTPRLVHIRTQALVVAAAGGIMNTVPDEEKMAYVLKKLGLTT